MKNYFDLYRNKSDLHCNQLTSIFGAVCRCIHSAAPVRFDLSTRKTVMLRKATLRVDSGLNIHVMHNLPANTFTTIFARGVFARDAAKLALFSEINAEALTILAMG